MPAWSGPWRKEQEEEQAWKTPRKTTAFRYLGKAKSV
jgi:hypothetical protein